MQTVHLSMRSFLQDQTAVTAIEYALIAALLAIALIAGAILLGVNLGDLYNRVAACITLTGCPATAGS